MNRESLSWKVKYEQRSEGDKETVMLIVEGILFQNGNSKHKCTEAGSGMIEEHQITSVLGAE